MNKESEFLKPVRERLSNPFIFSYILAWLIFNWVIVLGLLKYNMQDLAKDGFRSYMDLVQREATNWTLYWKPLISAAVYTFVFPLFRNLVLVFQAWVKKWGTNWSLRISKGGKVPVEKYLGLRSNFLARTKVLEEVLESESSFIVENKALTENIEKTRKEKQELKDTLDRITYHCNVSSYDGDWDVTDNKLATQLFRLRQGNMFLISGGPERSVYNINNICFNPANSQISITFFPLTGGVAFGVVFQPQTEGLTDLRSTNGTAQIVTMIKK